MVNRNEVYEALDSERRYQNVRWPGHVHTNHSLEEWIVYMEDYLAEAKHLLSRHASAVADPQALDIIRKITAMGVACMEFHGAPKREGY